MIVAEQLAPYGRSIPKIYLACSMPSEERLQELTTFCRVAEVGFVAAAENLGERTHPGSVHPRLDSVRYIEDVRCRVAMFLAFQKKFRDELGLGIRKEGGRTDWISIDRPPDQPQWNATIHDGDSHCLLGVNLESAKRVFARIDMDRLANVQAQLPADVRCEISRVRFLGRNQRKWLPIRRAPAHMVADELDWLGSLAQTLDSGESLGYTVGFPLWARNEAASGHVHNEQLEAAYKVLKPLFEAISGRALDPVRDARPPLAS